MIKTKDIAQRYGIPLRTLYRWKDAKDWRREHYLFLEENLKKERKGNNGTQRIYIH